MTLTSPTMAGSKVGNWYTARSFVFSAPVAHRVWEGFKAILWIPQGHSAGTLFLLLFRDGIWNCFPVLVSKMINWNFKNSVFHTASIQSLQKYRKKKDVFKWHLSQNFIKIYILCYIWFLLQPVYHPPSEMKIFCLSFPIQTLSRLAMGVCVWTHTGIVVFLG